MVDGEVGEVSLVSTSSSSTLTAQARTRPAGPRVTESGGGCGGVDERRARASATGSGVARRAPLGGGGPARRARRGGGGTSTDEPAQVAAWREPGRVGGVSRVVKAGQLAGGGFTTWAPSIVAVCQPGPLPRPSMRLPLLWRGCVVPRGAPALSGKPASRAAGAARGRRLFAIQHGREPDVPLCTSRLPGHQLRGYATTGTTTAGGPHTIVAATKGFGGGGGSYKCNCHSSPSSRQRNCRHLCLPGADSDFKSRSGGGGLWIPPGPRIEDSRTDLVRARGGLSQQRYGTS